MDLHNILSNDDLYVEDGFWKFRLRNGTEKPDVLNHSVHTGNGTTAVGKHECAPIWIGTSIGPKGLTRRKAEEVVRIILPKVVNSLMTVAEFVERKFVPEYLGSMGSVGRIYYQSILKHVVEPQVVDRAFGNDPAFKKARLRFVRGWPYLDHVLLREVRPDSVQNLLSAALTHGYSLHTVSHIRNVVNTIFVFAEREMYFCGENPARLIKMPKAVPCFTQRRKLH
jgi:hypothetical protein